MHHQLPRKNKVYFLTPEQAAFEQAYITVREKEGRVLTDEEVFSLPHLPINHPKQQEWQKRNFTVQKVIPYIVSKAPKRILDLGCGNGWFTNILAQATTAELIGADVNVQELEQGARLFGSDRCHFLYGDIFSDQWPKAYFDLITLNACVQYFPDLDALLQQLMQLLKPNGEIHLLDSPFYAISEVAQAEERTKVYYEQQGVAEMIPFYHHQSWEDLAKYQVDIRFRPDTVFNKIAGKLNKNMSPFPWVVVKK